MEPTTIELNITKTLTSPIIVNTKTITNLKLNTLILRPLIKRIVFFTDELHRVIVYEGEVDFEAHKNDSQEDLITALLNKIDTTYTHA